MNTVKITSWNVAHLERLTRAHPTAKERRRRDAVVREIRELAPHILCLLEGPAGEAGIDLVANDLLDGEWVAVKAADGNYATRGDQWIWFLVRRELADRASLLPVTTWDAFAGASWPCHLWGEFSRETHRHYRHPQVLVLDWHGLRVEFIGLHLKSKFINQGERLWRDERERFIREALTARIKMATEAANVRAYIDAKFRQVGNPALFVLGDFNDGPGKEYFEEQYLFFDLIANIQGNVFATSRFLNHGLFDVPDELCWTVRFRDFVQPDRRPEILLDHILFSQGLVNGSLPWQVEPHAGKVEHEAHELVNAGLPKDSQTSDHRPVSLLVTTGPNP
ncbi:MULTISPECIES: endonuclease/exonuclease/phosphatase family protein [Geobacter]|uniref:endonuclease/exonuclease/phosphatase family protein n=1 Tax=Geobacter TaxID=28231 RepID=UPI002B297175|nr:endonuclease/exonuclease/phosphatase family protein [Geobacter sulfurreducens]BET59138.1 endonuclease/exonuclease/phosphatase family protein [Geobacter sp. 60473]HML79343.1 endonuclease/exonuclease/phosphatase family protein [Geobacter sulfurreducens]